MQGQALDACQGEHVEQTAVHVNLPVPIFVVRISERLVIVGAGAAQHFENVLSRQLRLSLQP